MRGLGLRVLRLFYIWDVGFGFGVLGTGFGVKGLGLRISGIGPRAP